MERRPPPGRPWAPGRALVTCLCAVQQLTGGAAPRHRCPGAWGNCRPAARSCARPRAAGRCCWCGAAQTRRRRRRRSRAAGPRCWRAAGWTHPLRLASPSAARRRCWCGAARRRRRCCSRCCRCRLSGGLQTACAQAQTACGPAPRCARWWRPVAVGEGRMSGAALVGAAARHVHMDGCAQGPPHHQLAVQHPQCVFIGILQQLQWDASTKRGGQQGK